MAAVKFKFENSFDNGAEAEARAAALSHQNELERARQAGHEAGFAEGHAAAMQEIAAQTQDILTHLLGQMDTLFTTVDGVRRQLIADGAMVAGAAGMAMGGRLSERLPGEQMRMIVADLINDVIDTPRLVLRVPPPLLDSTRAAVESIAQTQGFTGRLIFLAEAGYSPSEITIEWAHGGLHFSLVEQHERVRAATQAFVDSVIAGGELESGAERQP